MKLVLLSLVAVLPALAAPRIVYSKNFPGSVPAFALITLERDGKAVYKEAVDDDDPVKFQLRQDEADQIFALADKLDHFKRPLESELKVANMGMKTFRWEDVPAAPSEVKFNFTMDLDGRTLADWFDRMIETAQDFFMLQRAIKFDRLGVDKAILILQSGIERNRVLGQDQFLPMLDRIAKNDVFLNMARERAASIADYIRRPKPPANAEPADKPKN